MVWHSVFPVFTMASTILVIMAIMVPTMVESSPPGLLVVGGGGSPTTAEFLLPGNLSSPPYSCTLPRLPRHLRYHTLDMWDNQVITCLGDSCLVLGDEGWEKGPTLLHTRTEHTSAVTPRGLLLLGGIFSPTTTELVTSTSTSTSSTSTKESFTLNPGRSGHCSVQLDSTTVLVMGGATSPTSVTEYSSLHLEEVVVREVAELLAGRWHHACGTYRLGEAQMVLVSGGVGAGAGLDSTEVLELPGGRWRSASPLPSPRWGVRGTSVAGVVHVSGGYDTRYSVEVLAWSPGEEAWRLAATLGQGRYYHAGVEVPSAMLDNFCTEDHGQSSLVE